MKETIKNALKVLISIFFLPIWLLEKLIPRNNNIWIFGARGAKEYSDNSKYLYEYVTKNCVDICAIWITKSNDLYIELRSKNNKIVKYWSIKGIYYSLKAGYAFITTSKKDINSYFSNGCRIIWLFHGMPLKKIGVDDVTHVSFDKKITNTIINILAPYYSRLNAYAYISASNFFTPFIQAAWKTREDKVWPVGQPRCDILFSDKTNKLINNIRELFVNCKIILFMPTFRKSVDDINKPLFFNPFIKEYGFENTVFFNILKENNLVFIYKPHFHDRDVIIDEENERFINLGYQEAGDVYELLNNIDLLVTDYSSVYFDFICKLKPILLFTPDYEQYLKFSREHYFDMFKEMRAPVCRNWNDVCNQLSKSNWIKPDNEEYIKFAEWSDGHSSEKIVNKIMENEK